MSAPRRSPRRTTATVLRLARRMMRSRPLARSTSLVFVCAALIMTMFVLMHGSAMSGEQAADRDLGRFDGEVGSQLVRLSAGDDDFVSVVAEHASRAGIEDHQVFLVATDVPLDVTPAREVWMVETDWSRAPYPDRYELLSGSWPSDPGEVAVTEPDDLPFSPGEDLTVAGGTDLQITGVVEDRFASQSGVLAAPGTWASLDTGLSDGFDLLTAGVALRWSGADADEATGAYEAALSAYSGEASSGSLETELTVDDTVILRELLLERPDEFWIEQIPAAYEFPSWALPVVAVFLVFGLNHKRFRRSATTMVSLGVRPGTALSSVTLAAAAWSLIAAVAGTALGLVVGLAASPVLAHFRERPIGSFGNVGEPLLRTAATVLVAAIVAGAAMGLNWRAERRLERRAVQDRRPERGRLRDLRHLVALAAWLACVVYALRTDMPDEAMILSGILAVAVALIVPDLLRFAVRLLPTGGPRRRLAGRQLAAETPRVVTALVVLSLLVGSSLGVVALVSTFIRSADASSYPDTLPGQILLADRASDTFPPSDELLEALARQGTVDGLEQIEFRYLMDGDEDDMLRAVLADQFESILAVQRADQVGALLHAELDADQLAVLENGGMLIWSDFAQLSSAEELEVELQVIDSQDTVVATPPTIRAATVEVATAGWRVGTSGIMLGSTAYSLGLPMQEGGPIMLEGASADRSEQVQQVLFDSGLDPKAVKIFVEPDSPIPPVALIATAVAMVLLALTAVAVVVRGQTRALRRYLAAMLTIGVPPSWVRNVLLYQHGFLLAAATALGLVIAVIPPIVLVSNESTFQLSLPWGQMALLLAAVYGGAAAAMAHGMRKLSASEAREAD